MKNTIITLASVAALAGAANAQVVHTAFDISPQASSFTLDNTSTIGNATNVSGVMTSTTRTGASTPEAISVVNSFTSGDGITGVVNYWKFVGQTYDPSSQADGTTFTISGQGLGIFDNPGNHGAGLFAKQNGVYYTNPIGGAGSSQPAWAFLTTAGAATTGITTTGGLVEFGFYTANTTTSDAPTSTAPGTVISQSVDYDDISVQLTAHPVPEPSSTALLGLGGLALILRRRK